MCARVTQHLDDVIAVEEDGVVQWRVTVAVTDVDRRSILQHVAHDLYVTFTRGDVQCSATVVVTETEVGPLQQWSRDAT